MELTLRQKLKDDVWMNSAQQQARLSKDENTKIGAVIVHPNGRILSTGYNGGVQGIDDSLVPHCRDMKELMFTMGTKKISLLSNKYPFMVHAEQNAIEWCVRPEELVGSTIYVTGKPCPNCAWNIVRHGISRVVIPESVDDTKSSVGNDWDISLYMFSLKNVEVWIGNRNLQLNGSIPESDIDERTRIS